jgi:8-oxo-dGTP diphosphatase
LDALHRECLEEIGCQIKIIKDLGIIVEYRNRYKLKQISYCYLARLVGKKGKSNFTKDETKRGFKVKWVSLSQAIKLLTEDQTKDYDDKFIRVRDLTYLIEAKKYLRK